MSLILKINTASSLFLKLQPKWLYSRQVCITPKRSSLNTRLRRIGSSAEKERMLKENDRIPEDFELIYRSTAGIYFSLTKYCVMLSSAAVVGLATWQLLSDGGFASTTVPEIVYGGLVAKKEDLIYFSAGFVAINLAFSAILWRYPLRIYRNVDKYIATYESLMPFRGVQHHHFSKGQVSELKPWLDTWKECYYRLGNRKSLLFLYYFRTPSEFNNMF